jgi:hypothetical protein
VSVVVGQTDKSHWLVSAKCDNCNFALTTSVVIEETLEVVKTGLVHMLPFKHACPAIKGENK